MNRRSVLQSICGLLVSLLGFKKATQEVLPDNGRLATAVGGMDVTTLQWESAPAPVIDNFRILNIQYPVKVGDIVMVRPYPFVSESAVPLDEWWYHENVKVAIVSDEFGKIWVQRDPMKCKGVTCRVPLDQKTSWFSVVQRGLPQMVHLRPEGCTCLETCGETSYSTYCPAAAVHFGGFTQDAEPHHKQSLEQNHWWLFNRLISLTGCHRWDYWEMSFRSTMAPVKARRLPVSEQVSSWQDNPIYKCDCAYCLQDAKFKAHRILHIC